MEFLDAAARADYDAEMEKFDKNFAALTAKRAAAQRAPSAAGADLKSIIESATSVAGGAGARKAPVLRENLRPGSLEATKDRRLFKHVLRDGEEPWDAAVAPDNLRTLLPAFDYDGNNSLVLRGLAPEEGTFEIALSPDGMVENEAFFLCKVRMVERRVEGWAKVNETWEKGMSQRFRFLPFHVAHPFFLRIVMRPDGFGLFLNGSHLLDMPNVHRDKTGKVLPKGQKLYVVLRKSGDYGELCSLRALGLWWGHSAHEIVRTASKRGREGDDDADVDPQVAAVRGLAATVSMARLTEVATRFGEVVDVDEPAGGRARVTFRDPSSVTAMIGALSGTTIDGQVVTIEVARRGKAGRREDGGGAGGF